MILHDKPPVRTKIGQNLSKINFCKRHPNVRKHHLGVNNDYRKRQDHNWRQNPDSWNPTKIPKFFAKIRQNFTSKDVTQPFKSINWVSTMIPENTRPITGVKIESSWKPPKIQIFGAKMASQKCPGVFLCQTVRPNNLGIELLSKNPFQKCIFFLISISFTMWKSNYVPKNTSAHIFPVDPQIA